MKMTQEEIILIEAVRSQAMLYDTNHPEYRRAEFKDEIWNDIAKQLNVATGSKVKNAWLKLRNCHRDALRRQRKCLRSGAPISSIKKWKFQKQMEFLVPYMANKWDLDNESDTQEDFPDQSENTDSMPHLLTVDGVLAAFKTENLETPIFDYEEAANIPDSTPSKSRKRNLHATLQKSEPTKNRRLSTDDPLQLDNPVPALRQAVDPSIGNEFSIFGQHVASQLQRLPLEVALRLQEEIQSILTRARLRSLKENE